MSVELEKITELYLEKPKRTKTSSGVPLKEIYTPEDVAHIDYSRDIADAGQFPFTRGIHPDMYRGKLWTRRLGWGYGTPKESNRQFKFLLREGNTALTLFPDLPLVEGIDPDHPLAKGEVGKVGAAYYSLEDMEDIMEGIPLDKISVALLGATCAAPVILSFYIATAEKRGLDPSKLRGTTANDPLHGHYCRSKEANPVDLAIKTAVDIIEYTTKNMPYWNPVSVNSYDMRDTGITAPQEAAFGLAIAIAYVEGALKRGLKVDDFAPRISFYCNAGIDIFEEVAKLRAMRKMWAKIMRSRYKAKDPMSWKFRFATHTSGTSLTAQQPLNNIIRIAYEQLVAVLGGVQSLNSCTFVEAISVPTDLAQQISLRTQEILAYETGVALVADPLGGSYYVEYLTHKIEEEATRILEEIDGMGGMTEAMRTEWIDREIEKAALQYQQEVESKERIIVGQNAFTSPPEEDIVPGGIARITHVTEEETISRISRLREKRDNSKVKEALKRLSQRAQAGWEENLIPAILEAVKAYATMEEIMGTIREAYGYSWDPFNLRRLAV